MKRPVKIVLISAAVLLVVFCIGSYAADRALLGQTYARQEAPATTLLLADADIAEDYPFDDVSFTMGGSTLRGHVYGAANQRGLVVFRHGIFSQHQDYLALITALVDDGWKVFAYDALGCGESDGDSVGGFAQSPLDVHAAVGFARRSGLAQDMPVFLFGHSWGGYGVAGALDFDDGVAGCITMSGFDTPDDIIMESAVASLGPIAYTQRPFIDLIGWMDFGADSARSAARAVSGSDVPVLVIHGTADEVVSFDGASIIAERARIANPDVRYVEMSEPHRNGHNTYFYSPESQAYLDECAEKLAALEAAGDEEGARAFAAGVDKRRANTADPALMSQIEAFLAQCAERS